MLLCLGQSLTGGNADMTSGPDILTLYREFTDALTEVLAENSIGPARRGRLARASQLHRTRVFSGSRNCIQTMGRNSKRGTIKDPCGPSTH
jgi:hypothetical protein